MVVEAGDVRAVGIDLGRPVGHPFHDAAGDAGRLLDPDRRHGPQVLDLGGLADDRVAVRRQGQQAVDRELLPDGFVADDLGEELEGVLELWIEVLPRERKHRRREGGRRDRGDVVGIHEDRPVGVRADLEAAPVLPLVHVRIHVADDRVLDFPGRMRELRHRPDVDHLVNRRRQGDRCPGHPRDARAPDAAGDDDDLGFDRSGIGMDAADAALLDIDTRDLDARGDGQHAHLLRGLAHQRTGLERVHHADAGGVEATENDGLVDERNHGLDLGRGQESGVLDAPCGRCRHPPFELFHALRRPGDLDPAGLAEDAELAVLAGAVDRERRHLLRMVGQEDEVGGMPGGAARVRQRALLDQDDVAPAGQGEVVDHAVADDAGTDDDDARGTG